MNTPVTIGAATKADLIALEGRVDAKLSDIASDIRILHGMSIAGVALGISILVILIKLNLK